MQNELRMQKSISQIFIKNISFNKIYKKKKLIFNKKNLNELPTE